MGAIRGVPHPFPYQGSKRQLAKQIVRCIPPDTRRLVEPFVGSGAITLAAAYLRRARRFLINDIHEPLVALWQAIIQSPERLADDYESLWRAQRGQEREFYDKVRDSFNESHEPRLLLYLLARCVKAAVRYNTEGRFNNSPDNRRLGMHPDSMRRNILRTSELIHGKVRVLCQDYQEVLRKTNCQDVVYMDPPYQGVSDTRNHRYCGGVDFGDFVNALEGLNRRNVPYIVSYDGRTGAKVHGRLLPEELDLVHLELHGGPSTQATLLGRNHHTVESLYLSRALLERIGEVPKYPAKQSTPSLFPDL